MFTARQNPMALVALVLSAATAAAQQPFLSVITRGGTGSGTVIARSNERALIVTNAHVVPQGAHRKIWVMTEGKRSEARFVATYPHADLALVSAEISNPAARLAAEEPAPGIKVQHYGHATRHQHGIMLEWVEFPQDGGWSVISDLFIVTGDSGAALLNDKKEVVGVIHAYVGDPEVVEPKCKAVRLAHLKALISPYLKSWDFPKEQK